MNVSELGASGYFLLETADAAWIAADIVRFEDGKLAEHWDVLQDEATKAQSVSGLPMFGDLFPTRLRQHQQRYDYETHR